MGIKIEVGRLSPARNELKGWSVFIEGYKGQWKRMKRLRRRVRGLGDNEAADMLDQADKRPQGTVVVMQEGKA